ncbi:MAG: trypsin-like peptidase domain-containing protein [Armatimonadetes bacterium]|nr:trypsin-like peptidase domain-containing protein [Armatimonadota bacterium]
MGLIVLGAVAGVLLWQGFQHYSESHETSTNGGLPGIVSRPAPESPNAQSSAKAANTVEEYVVNVDTTGRPVADYGFFGFQRWVTPRGSGSGVIVRKDGFIVTNNHVVDDAQDIQVTLFSGRKFSGRLWARAPDYDLALVKINANDLPYARFADSEKDIRVGDPVIAVGNALGLGTTVTSGIISALQRRVPSQNDSRNVSLQKAIQTDAAINPGNSGGALALLDGRLIGINTAIYSTNQGGGNIGIGFAIPANTVHKALEALISKKTFESPAPAFMGVAYQPMSPDLAQSLNQRFGLSYPTTDTGVVVQNLVPQGPAELAGVKSYDQILEVDGKKLDAAQKLAEIMQAHKPGDVLKVVLYRPALSKKMTLSVKLSAAPRDLGNGPDQSQPQPQPQPRIPGWPF